MNTNTFKRCILALGALTALLTLPGGEAHALCPQVSTTDNDLYYRLHNQTPQAQNAWLAFHNHHYNTPSIVWGPVGYRTTWGQPDSRQEYIKHVLSSVLLEEGIHFGQVERLLIRWDGVELDLRDGSTRAFHSNEDYSSLARGRPPHKTLIEIPEGFPSLLNIRPVSKPWHLFNTLLIAEEHPELPNILGYWEATYELPWYHDVPLLKDWLDTSARNIVSTVTTYCGLYGAHAPTGSNASRASTLVHEGWHSRFMHPMTNHVAGPQGFCHKTDESCDTWYPHDKLDFDAGETFFATNPNWFLNATSSVRQNALWRPPLSTYQIHSEYLCDLADNSESWVPISVALNAALRSETFYEEDDETPAGNNPFINIQYPQYACGMPTPLYAYPVGSRTDECPNFPGGDGGVTCTHLSDCPTLGGNYAVQCVSSCCIATIVR